MIDPVQLQQALQEYRSLQSAQAFFQRLGYPVMELTDDERWEVYQAVVQLIKDRLVKARSV
mgnify:CR=1 FL=1